MFLTHKDDVGDHAKWKKAFPELERIIHGLEVTERQGTTWASPLLPDFTP